MQVTRSYWHLLQESVLDAEYLSSKIDPSDNNLIVSIKSHGKTRQIKPVNESIRWEKAAEFFHKIGDSQKHESCKILSKFFENIIGQYDVDGDIRQFFVPRTFSDKPTIKFFRQIHRIERHDILFVEEHLGDVEFIIMIDNQIFENIPYYRIQERIDERKEYLRKNNFDDPNKDNMLNQISKIGAMFDEVYQDHIHGIFIDVTKRDPENYKTKGRIPWPVEKKKKKDIAEFIILEYKNNQDRFNRNRTNACKWFLDTYELPYNYKLKSLKNYVDKIASSKRY